MKWFIFIGWFAPIILIAVYAFVRHYFTSFNNQYVYSIGCKIALFKVNFRLIVAVGWMKVLACGY